MSAGCRSRTTAGATAAAVLVAGVLASGVVALPGSAAAADVELWKIDAEADPLDRYVAEVDVAHLSAGPVVVPGQDPGPVAAPQPVVPLTAADFDPQEVLRGTAAVGEPAVLESVEGRLQLRGPRGIYILNGGGAAVAGPDVVGNVAADPAPMTTAYATADMGPEAVSPALLERLAATPGITSAVALHVGRVLLSVPRGSGAPLAVPGLRSVVRDIQGAVADIAGLPDDPMITSAWALHNSGTLPGYDREGADLGALGAWGRTRGAGVIVAVLDTGYGPHRDLGDTLWTNDDDACSSTVDTDENGKPGDCHGWNFATKSNDVSNASSDPGRNLHGTAVGSVIAGALGNGYAAAGIAPDAKIMPLVGAGSSVSLSMVDEAIRYATDHGADIINLSFTFELSGLGLTLLEKSMSYAESRGVLLVAAAGNDSGNRDTAPLYPASSANPALLTVGASTAEDKPAPFSAYGSTSVDV